MQNNQQHFVGTISTVAASSTTVDDNDDDIGLGLGYTAIFFWRAKKSQDTQTTTYISQMRFLVSEHLFCQTSWAGPQ